MSERAARWRGRTTPPRRREIPRGVDGSTVVQVATDAGPLWMPVRDGVMRPYLETHGTWEAEQNAVLRQLVRPGTRFVDVGANVGYVSRLVAGLHPDVTVDAVEPHPEFARLLDLNTWEFGDRVTVWPVAVGDTSGTVGITVARNNVGDSRVWERGDVVDAVAVIAPLDDLLTGRVDLVKIDVQGYEFEVVCGMRRILRENAHLAVVVEYWPGVLRQRGSDPRSVLGLYRETGLEVCLVRQDAALPASDAEILEFAHSAGDAGQATLLLRRTVR